MLGLKIRYKNAFSFVHRCNLYCFDHRISTRKALGESVIAVTPVGEFPHALEFNPSNNNIYVANRDSGTVSVIDSTNNTLLENVVVGTEPIALEFNPSNNNIYVANIVSNSVSMIESMNNTVGGTVNVSSLPIALVFNPSNGGVYVGGTLTGTEGLVSVIG
jgi:YVTN family beta-propeller protein